MSGEENRRKYLRIDDRVSLYVQPLTETETEEAISHFETRRMDFSLMSHLVYGREQHMPQMRIIEKRYPEVAGYLKFLGKQIETLSSRIIDQDHRLNSEKTCKVNISAEGLRFDTDQAYPPGAMFELALMLFPSRTSMLAFGEVVRSEEATEKGKSVWKTAIRFTHLHEEDREILIKHIHQKQLSQIRQRDENKDAEMTK